jgi:hypothetical protein
MIQKGNLSLIQKSGDHTPYEEWKVKVQKTRVFLGCRY